MEFLRHFHRISATFWWRFHDIFMEFWWHFHWIFTAFSWHFRDILVEFWWHFHGIFATFPWHFRGILVTFPWNFRDIFMTFSRHFHGIFTSFPPVSTVFVWSVAATLRRVQLGRHWMAGLALPLLLVETKMMISPFCFESIPFKIAVILSHFFSWIKQLFGTFFFFKGSYSRWIWGKIPSLKEWSSIELREVLESPFLEVFRKGAGEALWDVVWWIEVGFDDLGDLFQP